MGTLKVEGTPESVEGITYGEGQMFSGGGYVANGGDPLSTPTRGSPAMQLLGRKVWKSYIYLPAFERSGIQGLITIVSCYCSCIE